jgi:hypothetical protein
MTPMHGMGELTYARLFWQLPGNVNVKIPSTALPVIPRTSGKRLG